MLRLLLALLTLASCATTPRMRSGDWDTFRDVMRERMRDEMNAKGSTAAAIVVVSKDAPIWIETFGEDGRFRVGSLSKYVTSLIARRALDIDAPLEIQTTPPATITPRLLMTHHSRLPSNILRGMYGTGTTIHDHARGPFILTAHEGFSYSDLGYTILGAHLEKTTGSSFNDLAKQHVLDPLGMTQSTFELTNDVVKTTFVENPPITIPANGLVTTPNDIARLAMYALKDEHEMHPAAPIDLDWRTGFGINMNDKWAPHAGPIYWHSGQTLAFTAEMVLAPKVDVGVVVLTNSRSAGFLPSQLAWEAMAHAIAVRTGEQVIPPLARGRIVDDIAGAYPTEYGLITIEENLRGRAFDEVIELVPTDRNTFVPRILAFGVLPVTPDLLRGIELSFDDVDGQRILISHQRGQRVLRGVRIKTAPISRAWRARIGRWANPQQGNDQLTISEMNLVEENGFLVAKIQLTLTERALSVPFTPLDDRRAITAGLGRYLGETVVVDDDGRMHVVGYALEKAPPAE